jgi:hypothetical protein
VLLFKTQVILERVFRWYDGIVCVQGASVEGGLKRALNVVTGLQSRRSSLWSAAYCERKEVRIASRERLEKRSALGVQ